MTNAQLRDRHVGVIVESIKKMDSFYDITPEERHVLDVIHGVADFAEESGE